MSLTARILLAFGIMALGGLFLVLNPALDRVERQVLEAAEEPMVDTAEILAAWVSRELESTQTPPANLALAFADLQDRSLTANIYDLTKTEVSMDVYLTDARGVVRFDSGNPTRVGMNFSHFLDVWRTLRGEYGARSTRVDPEDDSTSVMHVAAPLIVGGEIVGVLTVYKPQQSLRAFMNETRRRLWWVGGAGIGIFLLVGIGLSRWVTAPLAALTRHAEAVSAGERPHLPRLPGRHLRVLGAALEDMRVALEDRKTVERYVQTLSHEMKSPVAAIQGAAELLAEDLPDSERARFLINLQSESKRLKQLIDRLLALAELENRRELERPLEFDLRAVAVRVCQREQTLHERVRIQVSAMGCGEDAATVVCGDEFLLETAIVNLVQNAVDFSDDGGSVEVRVEVDQESRRARVRVADRGVGIPDYAVEKIFSRFYSLPRPGSGRKSSGLGLCLVAEIAHLHGGRVSLHNRTDGPGAEAVLELPL